MPIDNPFAKQTAKVFQSVDRALSLFQPFRLTRSLPRFLFLWLDVLLFNLFYFLLVKALIFYPLAYSSAWQILLYGLVVLAILLATEGMMPWRDKPSAANLLVQVGIFFLFATIVTLLSNVEIAKKGMDFSWLRPEMIKVPYWIRLFVPLSPIFTVAYGLAVSALIWLAVKKPRSRALRLAPTLITLLLTWLVLKTFHPFGGIPLEPDTLPLRIEVIPMYFIMFVGPSVLFCVLMWAGWFSMVFRVAPLVFHMTLIFLNYVGVLPVQSIWDLDPARTGRSLQTTSIPGVTLLYPPPGANVDTSFLFQRKLVVTDRYVFVNYGPTCGVHAIDRQTRGSQTLPLKGLMRDLQLSPDKTQLWGINWFYGDFHVMSIEPFERQCTQDLFSFGLPTPYNMLVDGNRIFISNVTFPVVSMLTWRNPASPCSLQLEKSIDFYQSGYTKFTDAAFGMHLDKERNRLYVNVSLVEGKYLGALVELDIKTFRILREVKMTTAPPIFPLRGRNHVLIPSYYTSDLHEVSLDEMTIVRTLEAEPNLAALEHDEKRGLFYAISRASGLLVIIQDEGGETIREIPVGAKPEPLWFDRAQDQLFIGSAWGILQIDLPTFFGEI